MAQGLISAGRNRRAGPRRRGLHIPRFAQKGKARSFHRSASPTQTRFAWLCVGAACGGHCGRIGVHPSRISCHGWPELLRKGVGVSPVNGGPGRTNWSRRELVPDGDVSLPRRRFGSFFAAKKELAQRAKPCETARRVVAPYGCHGPRERAGLGPAPTTSQTDRSRTGQWEGQAPPLRDGWGDIPRRRTSGRPHGAPPTAYPSGPPDNPRKHRKSPPA